MPITQVNYTNRNANSPTSTTQVREASTTQVLKGSTTTVREKHNNGIREALREETWRSYGQGHWWRDIVVQKKGSQTPFKGELNGNRESVEGTVQCSEIYLQKLVMYHLCGNHDLKDRIIETLLQLGIAYTSATFSALGAAIGRRIEKKMLIFYRNFIL